jgi:hypothetical protein
MLKEVAVAHFNVLPDICLEWPRNPTEYLIQDSQCPGRDSNPTLDTACANLLLNFSSAKKSNDNITHSSKRRRNEKMTDYCLVPSAI